MLYRSLLFGLLGFVLLSTTEHDRATAQIAERTWQKLFDSPSAVRTVQFLNLPGPPRIGFIGCNEAVYRTSDGGATWQKCTVTAPNFSAVEFTFKDSLTGWFANYEFNPATQYAMVYKTTDGGLTWNPIYGPTTCCSSIVYRPENGLLLVASWYDKASSLTGHSCYSTDEGATWHVYRDFEELNGFAFLDSLNGIASARSIYIRTTDGGYTWNYVNTTGEEAWQPVAVPATKTYYALSEISRFLFTSTDNGQNFVRSSDTIGFTTGTLRLGSCGTLYAQFEKGSQYRSHGVIRSQDGGVNWVSIGGPVNDHDSRFYVRGGYIVVGGIDTVTKAYTVWRYVEDSTFLDGGTDDAPQVSDTVLTFESPECGTLDSSLTITYLNDCSPAELISADIQPSGRFALAIPDSLPVRLAGNYRIPIIYSPVDHAGDTAFLTLTYRSHGQDSQKIIRVIGSVPGRRVIARFALLVHGASDAVSFAGDSVPVDLVLLTDIPNSIGLDSIRFKLDYDENVATPEALTVSPLWSLRRSSSTFGETDIAFDRAKGMDVPANTVVATFMFRTMLTTSTATDITTKDFQINDADSIYLACTATALDPGAVHYTVKDTCGDAVIRQQLLGYADSQEPATVVTQSAILVRSGARSTDGGHVVVCDVLGHPIISTDVAASAAGCAVSIAALPSGVYFVRLTTNAGFIRTTRFIVSR